MGSHYSPACFHWSTSYYALGARKIWVQMSPPILASSSPLLSLHSHIYEMQILIPILENIEDLMGLYYSHFMDKETKASESLSNLLKITQLKIKLGKISIGTQDCVTPTCFPCLL